MTLTSLSFYLLVLALLVLYYLVPKRFQWVVLLIGSYAFYAFVCLRYMGFIVITTLTTYFGARGMDAMTARMEQTVAAHKQDWEREARKAYKKRCKSRRKALMIGILVFNFGILAVLKYYNFFAESMEALFASVGLTVSLGHIGLLLPLGISFYTFQSMGYVLDVYREKVPAERNVGKLALFVSFFPQIIQGPIGVYDQLAHQLYDEHKYNFDNIRYGAELILWGFFKKLVIADRAVGMIHTVAGAYTDYAGTYVLLAALVYALQLYADFSGGIDISRGVAQMFGITMGENFRRPYFSRTLTEYWHRWHISLGDWLRPAKTPIRRRSSTGAAMPSSTSATTSARSCRRPWPRSSRSSSSASGTARAGSTSPSASGTVWSSSCPHCCSRCRTKSSPVCTSSARARGIRCFPCCARSWSCSSAITLTLPTASAPPWA